MRILTFFLLCSSVYAQECSFNRGKTTDFHTDLITANDVNNIYFMSLGLPLGLEPTDAGDLNNDGEVDNLDIAIAVQLHTFSIPTTPTVDCDEDDLTPVVFGCGLEPG